MKYQTSFTHLVKGPHVTMSLLSFLHTACPRGTYRSASDPEGACLRCPANTETDEEAVPECECQPGYFRNIEGLSDTCPSNQQLEQVSAGCTRESAFTATLVKPH